VHNPKIHGQGQMAVTSTGGPKNNMGPLKKATAARV